MNAYDHEDCNPETARSPGLVLAPTLPRVEVAGMRVSVEKLHSRSAEYVVAVYVGNWTRYVYFERNTDPSALYAMHRMVCSLLVSPDQVKTSKKWTLDPDLSKGFGLS